MDGVCALFPSFFYCVLKGERMSSSSVIEIPLKGKNEVLELDLNDLPAEAQDIINILREEEVPLELWLRFALEYFRRGRPDAFQDILNASLSNDLAYVYSRQRKERVAILNALAAYYIDLAAKEKVRSCLSSIPAHFTDTLCLSLSLTHTSVSISIYP